MLSGLMATPSSPPSSPSSSPHPLPPRRPVASDGDRPVAQRSDSWSHAISGLGMRGVDKSMGASIVYEPLPQAQAELYWRCCDISGRIVETIPREMTREGHDVLVPGELDLAEELEHEAEALGVDPNAEEGLQYARAFGGGGIFMGVDDGLDLEEPLDLKRIKAVTHLTPLTPLELRVKTYRSDPMHPGYGWPEVYDLVPYAIPLAYGNTIAGQHDYNAIMSIRPIHASRIWRFDGVRTTRRARLFNTQPGWADSVLMRCVRVIQSFQLAWQGVGVLLQDFAPPVMKMKGLAEIVAAGEAGRDLLATRVQALELARSIARVTLVDSEEEYKRETTSLAGLAEVLDKGMLRVAAAADMPVGLLMGRGPSGLGASDDAAVRWFYDQTAAAQRTKLVPYYKWVYGALFAARGGAPKTWTVTPRPLWQLDAQGTAEVRKLTAETDQIYIATQVVTPAEIARSRFGGDAYSSETTIDTELRDEMLEDEEFMQKELGHSEEPPVEPPPQPGTEVVPPPGTEVTPKPKEDSVDRIDFIRQRNGKWVVLSEAGKVLGTHDTREEAVKQLGAIEASKARAEK